MDATDTVIHRKAQAGKQEFDARAMSPAKAMRLALSKAADAELGLPLTVTTVEQIEVTQSALRAQLSDDDLLLLLDGAAGRTGAAWLDVALLMALIEQQTMGHVAKRPATPRPLTRTDAALIAPFLDAVFGLFDKNLQDMAQREGWTGYRFGVMMEDPHGLCIALSAPEYHLIRLTLDLAAGARVGVLSILLPIFDVAAPEAEDNGAPGTDHRTLENIALEASVPLQAVLGRMDLPLERALALKVGELLPIHSKNALVLRLEGARGYLLSEAKLGQMNGSKAIRLISDDQGNNSTPAQPLHKEVVAPEQVRQPPVSQTQVIETLIGPDEPASLSSGSEIDMGQMPV